MRADVWGEQGLRTEEEEKRMVTLPIIQRGGLRTEHSPGQIKRRGLREGGPKEGKARSETPCGKWSWG